LQSAGTVSYGTPSECKQLPIRIEFTDQGFELGCTGGANPLRYVGYLRL